MIVRWKKVRIDILKVDDLLLTLNNDIRIIAYEHTGALFDKYLFETNWSSDVWGYYMNRKVKAIAPSGSESNVLKITLYEEGVENGK